MEEKEKPTQPETPIQEESVLEELEKIKLIDLIKKLRWTHIVILFSTLSIIIGSIFSVGIKTGKLAADIEWAEKLKVCIVDKGTLEISASDCTGKIQILENKLKFYSEFVDYVILKEAYKKDPSRVDLKKLENIQKNIETKLVR